MKRIYNECAEEALSMTVEIIKKYGPRVSGTEGCTNAATELEMILGKYCSTVRRESFWIHPHSLYSIGKIFTVIYLVGMIAFLLNSIISIGVGVISMLFGSVFCITQFILYLDTFDRLFSKTVGNNIVGVIEPKATAQQQVVIVGHHDSSYVYPFYEKMPSLFPVRLFIPILLLLICFLVSSYSLWLGLFTGNIPKLPNWINYALILGVVFVAPMYGYISKRSSPGAGDDLIGCMIGIKLADLFHNGDKGLKNTRIIVVLTDGEEVGQKGAKFFIKNNMDLLTAIKTIVINIESIYEYADIALVKRDRNGFTRLSKNLVENIRTVAKDCGHDPLITAIPFGGGGTDGGQFAREKIETISIIGMPTGIFRKEILFHTLNDIPEKITGKAVSAVIEIVSEYVQKIDAAYTTN